MGESFINMFHFVLFCWEERAFCLVISSSTAEVFWKVTVNLIILDVFILLTIIFPRRDSSMLESHPGVDLTCF